NSNLLIKKHQYLGNFQKIEIEFNKQKYVFTTNLIGKIQVKNLLFAALAASKSKIKFSKIIDLMSEIKPVEGRLENVGNIKNNSKVILDYAHTPDALKHTLESIKEQFSHSSITIVFGCGGDRDKKKRSIMGKIANNYCDKIFLTDDNPRYENPKKIRNQIKKKISRSKLVEDLVSKSCSKIISNIGHYKKLHSKSILFITVLKNTKERKKMTLKINSLAPDFTAETSEGKLSLHEWLGDSWGVLFSHPKDFTPVCTTELGALAKMKPEFEKRNVKVMGLSVDPVSDHVKWLEDIKDVCGLKPNYPIVADEDLAVAKLYNMLEGDAGTTSMGRTAVDNETVRTVYVIRPDKRIGLFLTYPMTTGRNFDEILRTIDSMQRTAKHKIATPANWQPGEDVIIVPKVTNDEAKKIYPDGWETIKPYLRKVPDPNK
ncbi:redoxin domain-containing protein, partial [Candidatus Pelagibacter sp.]|nr:redoxin domain-containing protein [Candidatus Pelagibacter sp.]